MVGLGGDYDFEWRRAGNFSHLKRVIEGGGVNPFCGAAKGWRVGQPEFLTPVEIP
jgi:hypothetical protein